LRGQGLRIRRHHGGALLHKASQDHADAQQCRAEVSLGPGKWSGDSVVMQVGSKVSHTMNQLILYLSKIVPLRRDADYHLIRVAMVFTFLIFGYQKWFSFEAHQITPFISHSPLVFWLIPAFGVRGASFFLGTTEWLFGTLIFLGFWKRRLGVLGALGSIVTFLGTVSIIPFLPNAWAAEAGGFPAMNLPVAFLMKDILFLAASFYLLKQDLMRVALEPAPKVA
jgi:uncharacterized membrane protein YkgB